MTSRMWPEVKKGRKYSREENITPKTQISLCLVTDVSVSRVFDKGFSPGIYIRSFCKVLYRITVQHPLALKNSVFSCYSSTVHLTKLDIFHSTSFHWFSCRISASALISQHGLIEHIAYLLSEQSFIQAEGPEFNSLSPAGLAPGIPTHLKGCTYQIRVKYLCPVPRDQSLPRRDSEMAESRSAAD